MERSETQQAGKKLDGDTALLLLFLVAVLAAYGITSFGVYHLIKVLV
mgnify:CR=1 FL=1|jgi:hypothetical protein